ncbi:hypothetical protein [Clostridium lacusfryxellense]|uniref:hypothetical protein n=1 Tax=Clostridium lacusfryxellense TaxID=205328 RepID=UPI001C0B3F72|nr:hypothetical protein [Clostridium lacusfryxellense]MBU3112010.1 hypothetical protein [Clostridium lacusfryxellense]
MSTMQEMQDNMTIFYYKSNGDIYSACSGIQDINEFFTTHSQDLILIIDEIVLPNDPYVLENSNKFKMNLNGEQPILSLKQESINQYPIIS